MKKAILWLLVLLCLCTGAVAEASRVTDRADLFTDQEEAALEAMIDQFRAKTGMDFVILTSDEPHRNIAALADDFYDNGGYNSSGALFLIDMYERMPYLGTSGIMINYMTDARIETALDQTYSYLTRGDYAGAAASMLEWVAAYVERGIPEGQYTAEDEELALDTGEIGLAILAAAIAAFAFRGSVKRSYNLKGSTYAYAFRENSTVTLTGQEDEYLRTTTTRVKKVEVQSSGSGGSHSGRSTVHRSSSGRSHGGGAGKRF